MGKFLQGLSEELSLYVRQLAWLNTAPAPTGPKGVPRKDAVAMTRLAAKQKRGEAIEMPPLRREAYYLIEYLLEVGPTGRDGAVVEWSEIQAWQAMSGVHLSAWDAHMLRRLSAAFSKEVKRAESAAALPPLNPYITEEHRKSVSTRIGVEFGAMAKSLAKGRKLC